MMTDEFFMREAIREAEKAFARDEVPVGCVVVAAGRVIARAHNLTETLNDVTAHAEMQAMTAAFSHLGGKYLTDCTVYITLEPCPMCAGALFWARPERIVFGAHDPKNGYLKHHPSLLHPKTTINAGIMAEEAAAMMRQFFQSKRY
ncbi:MAG: nucleoside deaminase [Bacteroidales bacterium]